MKIALIAGGLDSIPSKKFGAIEMILWNYQRDLEQLGHQVVIFNSRNLSEVAAQVNNGGFDFVELNYSEYVSFFLQHLTVPFCTVCHSGTITNRKRWSIGYYSVFYDTMKCPGVIAFSEEIKKMYIDSGYKGFIRVVSKGIDAENFIAREKGNNKAICLSRIEPRKRQAWLAKTVSNTVDLDFIGPIQDPAFKTEGRCRYLGYWMKEEVYEKLSQYSCFVLLSEGEAGIPLVVPEALAAGLSIVVSRSIAVNLDERLPFISILPDDISDPETIAAAINAQIENNGTYRPQIIRYAKECFDSRVAAHDLIHAAEEFRSSNPEIKTDFKVPLKRLPIYALSKFALFVKKIIRQ